MHPALLRCIALSVCRFLDYIRPYAYAGQRNCSVSIYMFPVKNQDFQQIKVMLSCNETTFLGAFLIAEGRWYRVAQGADAPIRKIPVCERRLGLPRGGNSQAFGPGTAG